MYETDEIYDFPYGVYKVVAADAEIVRLTFTEYNYTYGYDAVSEMDNWEFYDLGDETINLEREIIQSWIDAGAVYEIGQVK